MITVVNKEPPKEMYKEVTCERCGWTYKYLPHRDARKAVYQDYGGGSETWYYIPCMNTSCRDPDRTNGKTKIEVPSPR